MIFQRISILLFLAMIGCKSVSIGDIQKKTAAPGRPDQPFTIIFTGTITVVEPIFLNTINFENSVENLPFSIVRLPDGLLLSASELLERGNYYINVTIKFFEKLSSSEDTLLFNFRDSSGNNTIIKRKAVLTNNLLKK